MATDFRLKSGQRAETLTVMGVDSLWLSTLLPTSKIYHSSNYRYVRQNQPAIFWEELYFRNLFMEKVFCFPYNLSTRPAGVLNSLLHFLCVVVFVVLVLFLFLFVELCRRAAISGCQGHVTKHLLSSHFQPCWKVMSIVYWFSLNVTQNRPWVRFELPPCWPVRLFYWKGSEFGFIYFVVCTVFGNVWVQLLVVWPMRTAERGCSNSFKPLEASYMSMACWWVENIFIWLHFLSSTDPKST